MNQPAISDYIPVCLSTVRPSKASSINLFQRETDADSYVLYCAEGHPLEEQDLERLRHRGVSKLFIQSSSRDTYQQYLRDLIEPGAGDSEVSPEARVGALNDVLRDVLEAAFQRDDTNETVAEATKLGSKAAEIVCADEFASGDLFRVLHHDYATFTHSTNVAFYAGMLAAELGHSTRDVEQITTGGLLHDLGKLAIDDKILSKPGRLTDDEFDIIKMHPTRGFEQLNFREDLSIGQLMMVYQHHERLDGKGYPVGIVEDEIHRWAKICAVVDVFEAMTSFRPYRSPMPKARVIDLMQRDSGKAFDPEILACWVKITRAFWEV